MSSVMVYGFRRLSDWSEQKGNFVREQKMKGNAG